MTLHNIAEPNSCSCDLCGAVDQREADFVLDCNSVYFKNFILLYFTDVRFLQIIKKKLIFSFLLESPFNTQCTVSWLSHTSTLNRTTKNRTQGYIRTPHNWLLTHQSPSGE